MAERSIESEGGYTSFWGVVYPPSFFRYISALSGILLCDCEEILEIERGQIPEKKRRSIWTGWLEDQTEGAGREG